MVIKHTARPDGHDSREVGDLSRRETLRYFGTGGLAAVLLARGFAPAGAQEATPGPAGAYLAIRQYQLAAGHSFEDLVGPVETGFVPIISAVPGFQDYFLVDTDGGTQASISVFQDQAGADESTRRAADWVAANLAGFFEGPPTVTTGTVRIRHSSDTAGVATPTP